MIPGEIIVGDDPATLPANVGLETRVLVVANTGDRPGAGGQSFSFLRGEPGAEVSSARRRAASG